MLLFLAVERRSDHPMLELSLFRKPAFVGASIAAFVLSASMFAMFLYLTLYIQNQLDYSALESGLRFLPTTILSFFVAPVAGKLAERLGIRWFVGVGLVFVAHRPAADERPHAPATTGPACCAGLIFTGIGIGMVNPPLATAAVGVVEPWRAGMASGINSTFRQVGISTGIAAWGAIFASAVNASAGRVRARRRRQDAGGHGGLVLGLHLLRRLPGARRARRSRPAARRSSRASTGSCCARDCWPWSVPSSASC